MIFAEKTPWYIWVITLVIILLSLVCFTNPALKLNDYTSILFKSSARAFGVAILAAFLFFLMVAWFRVFLDILLILCATILARIDFQTLALKPALAFGCISFFAVIGLALGAFIKLYI
ncbi:MAG: hypothetical protein ACKPE1_18605 [Dolichospermum sp.]